MGDGQEEREMVGMIKGESEDGLIRASALGATIPIREGDRLVLLTVDGDLVYVRVHEIIRITEEETTFQIEPLQFRGVVQRVKNPEAAHG